MTPVIVALRCRSKGELVLTTNDKRRGRFEGGRGGGRSEGELI